MAKPRIQPRGKRSANLSLKQRQHLHDFGECHPADKVQQSETAFLAKIASKVSKTHSRSKAAAPSFNEATTDDSFKRLFAPAPKAIPQLEAKDEDRIFPIEFSSGLPSSSPTVFDLLQSDERVLEILSEGTFREERLPFSTHLELATTTRNHRLLEEADFGFPIEKGILRSKGCSHTTPLRSGLLKTLATQRDLLFSAATSDSMSEVRAAYAVHALNLAYKVTNPQGEHFGAFSRPSVLILGAFRNDAWEIGSAILRCSGCSVWKDRDRFREHYGPPASPSTESTRGRDYDETFRGNLDDSFALGISFFQRKDGTRSAALLTDLGRSDIIVASAVYLRKWILSQGNTADQLSSIRFLVLDQYDVLSMQNWEHVEFVLARVNQIPHLPGASDFSHLRPTYADGRGSKLRQSFFVGRYPAPAVNSAFDRLCGNAVGSQNLRLRRVPSCLQPESLSQNPPIRILPSAATTPTAQLEERFAFFTQGFLGPLVTGGGDFSATKSTHIVVFAASYFDFLRLERWMKEQGADFATLTEYTENPDIARTQARFSNGQVRFLLVTERFDFFKRRKLRGVRRLLFYQLPESAGCFRRWCEMAVGQEISLFTNRYDALRLQQALGSELGAAIALKTAGTWELRGKQVFTVN